jgi:hypothetical protein
LLCIKVLRDNFVRFLFCFLNFWLTLAFVLADVYNGTSYVSYPAMELAIDELLFGPDDPSTLASLPESISSLSYLAANSTNNGSFTATLSINQNEVISALSWEKRHISFVSAVVLGCRVNNSAQCSTRSSKISWFLTVC